MISLAARTLRFIKRKVEAFLLVKRDPGSGMLYYRRGDKKIFVRHRQDYMTLEVLKWHCDNLYWRHYTPKAGDVVVDLGAGFGEEAVFLASLAPNARYFGVEIQPSVYECLSNTFSQIPGYRAVPFAVAGKTGEFIRISSQRDYISVGSHRPSLDAVEVPTLSFADLLRMYGLQRVSLLKANIEGGERSLLEGLSREDFSRIDSVLISCHDFRANRGQSEYFRTKAHVEAALEKNNFEITRFATGIDSVDDWIFATNRASSELSAVVSS